MRCSCDDFDDATASVEWVVHGSDGYYGTGPLGVLYFGVGGGPISDPRILVGPNRTFVRVNTFFSARVGEPCRLSVISERNAS